MKSPPQAFEGLRMRAPHSVYGATYVQITMFLPRTDKPIADPVSAKQVETLRQNCMEFGITLFDLNDERQGIVHVVGPEQV